MARSNNVQQCPTWSCGIMWHHVASRGLLRLRFIYRRLCLSFCGSCLVFLHCHCMLLWSCDRCSYRSRQAMQLKKNQSFAAYAPFWNQILFLLPLTSLFLWETFCLYCCLCQLLLARSLYLSSDDFSHVFFLVPNPSHIRHYWSYQ